MLPAAETAYLRALTSSVRAVLEPRVVGIYLFGSAACGAYRPGNSDLDVQVVLADTLTGDEPLELARRLAHSALPCPARRLEFVCYALGDRSGDAPPPFLAQLQHRCRPRHRSPHARSRRRGEPRLPAAHPNRAVSTTRRAPDRMMMH